MGETGGKCPGYSGGNVKGVLKSILSLLEGGQGERKLLRFSLKAGIIEAHMIAKGKGQGHSCPLSPFY